jgi:RNA polymerase sigma-70 factor, ECF subfamily
MAARLPSSDESAALAAAQEAAQDTRLVVRVLRGDADAYGQLVSRHMRRAFSIAYRILEHREDAQDVVQDAFIRALERIDSLDRSRPFGPWFHRIVVNQALNFRRGRSLRTTQQLHDEMHAGTTSPEHDTERALLRRRLSNALATLPEKQRTIVQLADLEELTSAEIAQILDMKDGTVRWHLHQARRALRQVLGTVAEET